MSENILNYIQVGDQLYKIGGTGGSPTSQTVDPITDPTLNEKSYGVWWKTSDIAISADNMTKIGVLHNSLPIHNKLKRVKYIHSTGEVEYLPDGAVTSDEELGNLCDTLDSTDRSEWSLMVEVPHFYGRSWKYCDATGETISVVRISEEKIDDSWAEIPHCYISAFFNTYTETDDGLMVARCWPEESPFEGRLLECREKSVAAGGVNLYYELYKWIFIWLPVIEFGTFATTREYVAGGTESGNAWDIYYTNRYLPTVTATNIVGDRQLTCEDLPEDATMEDMVVLLDGTMGLGMCNDTSNNSCNGYTLALGNQTGKVILGSSNCNSIEAPICVYSWRGFENVSGFRQMFLDGFFTARFNDVHCVMTTNNRDLLADCGGTILLHDRTIPVSEVINGSSVPTELLLGTTGDIIPANNEMQTAQTGLFTSGNLSGMSDSSALAFYDYQPSACYTGCPNNAAQFGAFMANMNGPGFLGGCQNPENTYAVFRTVIFAD